MWKNQRGNSSDGGTPPPPMLASRDNSSSSESSSEEDDDLERSLPRPPPGTNDNNDDAEQDLNTRRLASAWFRRRHRVQSAPPTTSSSRMLPMVLHTHLDDIQEDEDGDCLSELRSSQPVDLDTGHAWKFDDDTKRSLDKKYRLNNYHVPAEHDRASAISAATSDRTPVVCNKSPPRKKKLMLHDHDEIVQAPKHRCDLFDYRTYHGKITLLLIAIFLLAVVTIVVSIVVAQQNATTDGDVTLDNETQHNDSLADWGSDLPPKWNETLTAAPSTTPITVAPSYSTSASPSTQSLTLTPSASPTVSFSAIAFARSEPILGSSLGDHFGSAVALSQDGQVMAVGARDAGLNGTQRAGHVKVYRRQTTESTNEAVWSQVGETFIGTQIQESLGTSLALNADGSMLVVGEPGHNGGPISRSGHVHTYQLIDGLYVRTDDLDGPAAVSYYGASLALANQRLAVGAPFFNGDDKRLQGWVQVYERAADNSAWIPLGEPILGSESFDLFGSSVALSEDGKILVASSPTSKDEKGYVRLFYYDEEDEEWDRLDEEDYVNDEPDARADDRYGHTVSLSRVDDETYRLAVSVPFKDSGRKTNHGMVLVYDIDLDGESQLVGEPIVGDGANEELGYSVQLFQGNLLAVGAPGVDARTGAVYLYQLQDGQWIRNQDVLQGIQQGDEFGYSVSLVKPNEAGLMLGVGAIDGTNEGPGYVVTLYQSN